MFDRKEWHKNYYVKHKEHLLGLHKIWLESETEYIKKWYEKNPEYNKQYYQKHQEKALEKAKEWQEQNPEKREEINRRYYRNHIKGYIERKKKFQEKNPDYRKNYIRRYQKANLKINLSHKIRTAIGISLKGNKKGKRWENLVGYTVGELIKRLKVTMPEGCNWSDYIKGKLHIDHIIPVRAFIFDKPEDKEFKQCWSLFNLRLSTKEENRKKNYLIQNPILLGLLIEYGGF